ncbi:hypothetical protein PHYPSEUDO_004971 [Phytophthora pseudosyringae]|uniref:Uncharacterized protein n=1 Tax=Phytophthora pseudosyringae TaxID=221518 RepID=A0A8T1WDH4_9STRA|nr:hypothetical protein PHYPSEUDO_004971 [Phytophthora pseudosyringae]
MWCLFGANTSWTAWRDPARRTLSICFETLPHLSMDPTATEAQTSVGSKQPDDLLRISSETDDDDIEEVRQMHRTLGNDLALSRPLSRHHGQGFVPLPAISTVAATTTTKTEAVFDHYLPSEAQAGRSYTSALEIPPVCRGLWEFGFLARGLMLMHCRPADLWDQVQAQESNTSFTDFSERNLLRAAPTAASRSDICGALRSLRVFAQDFYVDAVTSLIDNALAFVERYKGVQDTDAGGWKLMAFWVTGKFGKFRSLIVSRDLKAAQDVERAFSRVDEDLLELLDLRRAHRGGESISQNGHQTQDPSRRGERQRRPSSVPATVLDALPRQGGKQLCMKAISKMGCTGDGRGGCFDFKRAHFYPKDLPDVVKPYITEKYHGLAAEPKDE